MEGACNISFRAGGQVGEGNLLLQKKEPGIIPLIFLSGKRE
jgi:hypothetical protein